MTRIGVVRDEQIELDEPLDLPPGTRVEVFVRPITEPRGHSLIGLFADEPELLDAIIEEVMLARETRPLRVSHG